MQTYGLLLTTEVHTSLNQIVNYILRHRQLDKKQIPNDANSMLGIDIVIN